MGNLFKGIKYKILELIRVELTQTILYNQENLWIFFLLLFHTTCSHQNSIQGYSANIEKKTLKVFFLSNIMNLYFVYYDLIINNLALFSFNFVLGRSIRSLGKSQMLPWHEALKQIGLKACLKMIPNEWMIWNDISNALHWDSLYLFLKTTHREIELESWKI